MADAAAASKTEVTVEEVRSGLGELVNRVGYGRERIVITRFGKAVAALVSVDDLRKLEESAT